MSPGWVYYATMTSLLVQMVLWLLTRRELDKRNRLFDERDARMRTWAAVLEEKAEALKDMQRMLEFQRTAQRGNETLQKMQEEYDAKHRWN